MLRAAHLAGQALTLNSALEDKGVLPRMQDAAVEEAATQPDDARLADAQLEGEGPGPKAAGKKKKRRSKKR